MTRPPKKVIPSWNRTPTPTSSPIPLPPQCEGTPKRERASAKQKINPPVPSFWPCRSYSAWPFRVSHISLQCYPPRPGYGGHCVCRVFSESHLWKVTLCYRPNQPSCPGLLVTGGGAALIKARRRRNHSQMSPAAWQGTHMHPTMAQAARAPWDVSSSPTCC